MRGLLRSAVTAVVAVAIVGSLCLVHSVCAGVRLMSGTVLAMGGASNPQGQDMDRELSGYYSGSPDTPYAGYDFHPVSGRPKWSPSDSARSPTISRKPRAWRRSMPQSMLPIQDHHHCGRGLFGKRRCDHQKLRALESERGQGYRCPTRPTSVSSSSEIRTGRTGNPESASGLVHSAPAGVTFDGPAGHRLSDPRRQLGIRPGLRFSEPAVQPPGRPERTGRIRDPPQLLLRRRPHRHQFPTPRMSRSAIRGTSRCGVNICHCWSRCTNGCRSSRRLSTLWNRP